MLNRSLWEECGRRWTSPEWYGSKILNGAGPYVPSTVLVDMLERIASPFPTKIRNGTWFNAPRWAIRCVPAVFPYW